MRSLFSIGLLLTAFPAIGCNQGTPTPLKPPVEKESKTEKKLPPEEVIPVVEEKPTPPRWRPERVSGIPFHLQPLRWDAKEPRPKPLDVIAKLFPGLADDVQAGKLLARLHGDAEVTLLIRKLSEAEAEKITPANPPPRRQAIFWAITKWSPAPEDDDTEKFAPGRQLHLPVYLGWTYLTRFEREQPNSIPVLVVVANDYLLRHNQGYQLRHARLPDELKAMPGDQRPLKEVRAEVDRKIEELERNVLPK